jgi:primosomal protein N' (replication factor Y)
MQSYDPDHPALRCAAAQDYEAFFAHEAAERRELHYPPFGYLIEVELRGKRKDRLVTGAATLRESLARMARGSGVELLGPAPKPLARLQGTERWHILVRSTSRQAIQDYLKKLLPVVRGHKIPGVTIALDVDPRQVL